MKPLRLFALVWATALLRASLCAAEAPKNFTVGEFTFARPASFEWVETTSSMRKAQMKVTASNQKEAAELIFFYFGEGGAGGTPANVNRWLAQFQEPRDKINAKVEEVTINTRKVTYVQAEGTYLSGMPAGPKTPQPNSMLLGAIIESPQGNVFARMTGPKDLVRSTITDFKKMIESGLN